MLKQETKECNRCKKNLNISNFTYEKSHNGYRYVCRKCDAKRAKEYFERTNTQRRESLRANWRRATANAMEKHPEKWEARRLTRLAVLKGELEQGVCEVCGVEETQAHHDDYSKPLNVRWLCKKHHYEEHLITPTINNLKE